MEWFRSYHGAPFDPKWRVIAKQAGARVGEVAAVFWALMDYASQAEERGVTHCDAEERHSRCEEIAAAFDFDEKVVDAVYAAFEARNIIADGRLVAWEKRQPKREDSSADRTRSYRERNKVTQGDAHVTPCDAREDKIREEKKDSEAKASGAEAPPVSPVDLKAELWRVGKDYLGKHGHSAKSSGSVLGGWRKDFGDLAVLDALAASQAAAASDPVAWITKALQRRGKQTFGTGPPRKILGVPAGSPEDLERRRQAGI
jgi:hypothetical protein